MTINETRIGLTSLTCPGCDCGACVTLSIQEIAQTHGVVHVRIDRRRTEVVVRHEHDAVTPTQISTILESKGIELTEG